MSAVVEARELFKFHQQGEQRIPILRGVSFAVHPGEFVSIMGPSGSGKSTLLHLLSGLDQPSSGSVALAGQDLAQLPERRRTLMRRSQVGYVFQFFNLLPNLTVRENISLPIAIDGRGVDAAVHDRVQSLATRLGLEARLDAFPHQLSGGEMQRTSIARALMGSQPLLLCDEPTGNLSQKAGAEVMQLLRRCCDEDGRAVLLVTHNPRDAAFGDRVLFLVDGELAPDTELGGPDLSVEDVHEALKGLSI
ncbi:MAG: ABC transporter ATP-binding protein [Planctomycetota bacterium]|nr:ABC transporter ATP-binding protein [Planctomycetota bacterium]